jgi:hypothetical protein
MLIRKILIVGACDSRLVFPFAPEDVSVIGKEEEVEWLRSAPGVDFVQKMEGVRAAVVFFDSAGEQIFKRLVNRGIPSVLILIEKPRNVKASFVRQLVEQGARGIFFNNFAENPLAIQEFYRQVKKFIT